jgi:hypothetical protein
MQKCFFNAVFLFLSVSLSALIVDRLHSYAIFKILSIRSVPSRYEQCSKIEIGVPASPTPPNDLENIDYLSVICVDYYPE